MRAFGPNAPEHDFATCQQGPACYVGERGGERMWSWCSLVSLVRPVLAAPSVAQFGSN